MNPSAQVKTQKVKTILGVPWKTISIAFAVWTILGLSFASESYLRNYRVGRILPVKYFIIEFLTEFYLYAIFSIFLFKIGKKFPLESKMKLKNFVSNIILHLLASIIFSFVNVALGSFIAWAWEDICTNCLTFEMMLDPHFLHRGIIVYWGIIIVGRGIQYYREMESEKVRVAELSSQLSAAQFNALKMQIHPHFLFNTLNSIAALIQEDRQAAELMLTKLSDFLRMTLQSSVAPITTLKDEFNFLKTYLEIEKVRFQERLTTEFIYEEEILSAKIPHLLLQPIVENSIKHGISNRKKNGYIKILACQLNNRLMIEVKDNGKEIEDGKAVFLKKDGLGLKNTISRLEQIYGEDYFFAIKSNPDKGTTIVIEIPFS